MPNKATVHLVGHAGQDSAMKYTQSGTAYMTFTVATNKWQPNEEDTTTWWAVSLWGQRAERLRDWGGVAKGEAVYVVGEPYLEEWTDREGNTRQTLKVRADEVIVLSKRDRAAAPGESASEDMDIPF